MTRPLSNRCLGWSVLVAVCVALGLGAHLSAARRRGPGPQVSEPPAADGRVSSSAAIDERLRSYVAAIEREDADEVARAWSSEAPDREAALRAVTATWRALDYRFDDVRVDVLEQSLDHGRARVSALRRETGLAPLARDLVWTRIFDLARPGEAWLITSERSPAEVFADTLTGLDTVEARADAIARTSELVGGELGEALMRLADRAHIERRLETAFNGYSAVVELGPVLNDANLEVAALQNLGNIHYVRQAFSQALEMYERRLAIEQGRGNSRGAVVAWQAIASAHYAASRYDLAQSAYERLVALERQVGSRASVATTLANLGNVYYLQGVFEPALAAYRDAWAIQSQIGNEEEQARLEFGIGRALTALGAFGAALTSHRQALERRTRMANQAEIGASQQELARVLFLAGSATESLAAYDQALGTETRAGNAAGIGRILLSKGLVRSTQGRYTEALRDYRESIASFEAAGEVGSTGYGWLGAGSVQLEMGEPDKALIDYQQSRKLFEAQQDRVGLSRALVGMSIAHVERRAFDAALLAAEEALALARDVGALESWWQAEFQRGRALWFLGRRVEALAAYAASAAIIDDTRDESASRNDEGRTLADRVAPFTAMVEARVHAGEAVEALVAAEEQKARLIQELIHEHRWRLTGDLTRDEAEEERRLVGQLVTTSQQWRRARARVPHVPEVVAATDARRDADRAALRASRERLDTREGWRASRGRRAVTAEALSALASPGRAVVEWVVGDAATFVITVLPGAGAGPRVRSRVWPVTRRELTERILVFEASLSDADSGWESTARDLYDHLLGDITEESDVRELVVVPDGPLWRLSFGALLTSASEPLGAATTLRVVPALLQVPSPTRPLPAPGTEPGVSESAAASTSSRSPIDSGGTRWIHGRVVTNDISPFHGTADADAARELLGSQTSPELDAQGTLELRTLLHGGELPARVIVESMGVGSGDSGEGEGLLGALWALGTAGAQQVVFRTCEGPGCADRRALRALEATWLATTSASEAVRLATRALCLSDDPPPPRVWASLVVAGVVP